MHLHAPTRRAAMRCSELAGLILAAALALPVAGQQAGSITGTVVDKAGRQPLNGVQVSVDGTTRGGLTDARGRYTIAGVALGQHTVRATYIGYRTETQQVAVAGPQAATLDFEMGVSAVSLDEVVVTGTAGAVEKKQLGATVSTVSVANVQERMPVMDVGTVLQSRLPGVRSVGTVGGVGASRDLRIRGTSSMQLGQRPVVYVDGVKVDNRGQEWGSGMGTSCCSFSGGAGVDRLSDLNPNDIDRIEVIKGAAAGTLYGSEATNGVIQIFTKRGRSDSAPRWTAQATTGFQRYRQNFPTKLYPTFTGQDGTRALDPNETLVDNGPYTGVDMTVQGGSSTATYFVSGGYVSEQGSIQPNWMKRGNLRLNLHWLKGDKLSFDVTSAYTRNRIFELQSGNNWTALLGNALYGTPYNASAARPYGEPWVPISSIEKMETTDDVNRWTGGVTLNYNPVARFTNKFQLGLDALNEERSRLQPFGHPYTFVPEGEKGIGYRNFRSVTAEYLATLAFDQILPNLSSRISFGAQGFQTMIRHSFAVGNGYAAPGVTTVRGGRTRTGDELFEEIVQVGFFGQNRFSFYDRLYLTTGVRVDGNSAFGDNYGFQVYPNVQMSYDASNDSWKPSLISNLRFRGAVGTAGLAPGAFDKFLTFTPFTTGENESGVRPNDPGNPDLGPERTTEIEAGFEAGFLNERVGLDLTVYRRVTKDAILDVALPPSLRFGGEPRRNVGEILDQGYEVALRVTPIESSRLRWSADVRVDGNHNEITDLGTRADTAIKRLGNYRVGLPVRHSFSRKTTGWNPTTRAFTLTDTTVLIGRNLPGFNASLGNEITFGAFRFYALFSLEQGAWFNNGTRDQSITFRTNDEYLSLLGDATGPNCLAPIRYVDAARRLCETAASDSTFKWASAIAVQDKRDNVRLRELSLSYVVPEALSAKLGLSRTMITLAGQNLHWWDGCHCLDPNVNYQGGDDDGVASGYLGTPQPRQFKLSIRTSF